MENKDRLDNKKKIEEELIVPLMVLSFLICAWLVYVYENKTWIPAFQQVISWIINPTINYTPIQIEGLLLAFLATIEVLILGVFSSHLLLANEKDASIKFISALGMGFGLTGLVTIVLGIFGSLYRLPLNAIILLLCIGFLPLDVYKQRGKEKASVKKFLADHFSVKRLARLPNFGVWSIAYLAIGIIFFFCFYHALLTIIVHWDATVYHAVMSVIMYNDHAIPLIAGPSIGIEMSANFPPLFSAIGAYYYIQIGAIEDVFLRAISPVMGVLTVIATYKIGELLGGRKLGLISALFLTMTPLFFRYSTYATSYATLTFFCTVSILFLLLVILKREIRYWVASGLFYGFALLTSYMALYLAPFFVAFLIYYSLKMKTNFKVNLKYASALVLSTLIIGGIWYFRNAILLGNPIYPNAYTILGGINIDPSIMKTTFNGIKTAGTVCFFGGEASVFEKVFMFLIYRTHFPAISLFTILGIALLPTQDKKFWLISIWPLTLSVFILSGLTWAFPRHVMFTLPGFAILGSLPIVKALEKCEEYDKNKGHRFEVITRTRIRLPSLYKSDFIRIGLVVLIFAAFLFPSLTLSFGGKLSMDDQSNQPPNDYLWLFKNPNGEKWFVLTKLFPEAIAWKWLDEHIEQGEKVATVENRIYYVKNSSTDYFFYLDGWEARRLYNISNPSIMLQFLQRENVKYILDVAWTRTHGHFDILPMAQYLGSPYFPKIVDCSGNPDIYNVGPLESPITSDSSTAISINQEGWSAPQIVDGVYAQSIIAGNNSARLLVDTSSLTGVNITYHDVGTDSLSINLYNPYSKEWIYGYGVIQKNNTGEWKTYEFLAPLGEKGSVELALHAYTENFTIRKIEAAPYESEGKVSLNSSKKEITNMTVPPALMVYLPILNESKIISVQTNSFGKSICVEIFEGAIQPWESTEWWRHHELAVRSPNSAIYGNVNPSLVWNVTKSGLYTMVIVLREGYNEDNTKVDLQVSIGGSK